MRIVLTGGGSGGHIFPLIAVVREIKKLFLQKKLDVNRNVFGEQKSKRQTSQEELDIRYLGPRDDFGLILLSQEGIRVKEIFAGKLRRYFDWQAVLNNIVDIFIFVPVGFIQSFFYLFFAAPDLVFSKGGYGSFPVVIAAWFLGIPVFLHESDVDPGLSNKFLAKFCKRIFTSFPKTERFPPSRMVLIGNPIRKEVLDGNPDSARDLLRLSGGRPVVFISGGSQGAQRVNDMILAILPDLIENFEILHQTGENNFTRIKAEAAITLKGGGQEYYHLFPFLREEGQKQAYAAASIIVSRAGSGMIFEIAAMGKPSILIPLPEAAQNHQVKNAYAYASSGAAVVLEQENLTPNFFLEKLKFLSSHPEEMKKMSLAALSFARPEAARKIAEYLFNFLRP